MNVQPTQLQRLGDSELLIVWSDGEHRTYRLRELRDRCPCASCREQRAHKAEPPPLLPIVRESDTQPLRLIGMKPVGNYAYSIQFSDGHDTGIYTFELLRSLGRAAT
jgi:DUF971 family protein